MPVTFKEPPTLTLSPIPTPPSTTRAPVVELELCVVFVEVIIPAIATSFEIVNLLNDAEAVDPSS